MESIVMSNQTKDTIEEILDSIRQTCDECEHPRCVSIKKSALTAINKEIERIEQKGYIGGHYAAAACLGELDSIKVDGEYYINSAEAKDYICSYAKEEEKELAELTQALKGREGEPHDDSHS